MTTSEGSNDIAGVMRGDFVHVAGTFDLSARTGTIDYVTPVKTATMSDDLTDEGIHLVGEDAGQRRLFDQVVNPQRNSCAPRAKIGTFDEFVPVPPSLHTIRLTIAGETAAQFTRGTEDAAGSIAMGTLGSGTPHSMAIAPARPQASTKGMTYAVQAKTDGSEFWQTLAVGLPTPRSTVDVNQFPGAKSIEIRVLQSDGFSEREVFRDKRVF